MIALACQCSQIPQANAWDLAMVVTVVAGIVLFVYVLVRDPG